MSSPPTCQLWSPTSPSNQVTSAYYYPDVNEHAYIMAVAQHPYESRERKDPAVEGVWMIGLHAACGLLYPPPGQPNMKHQWLPAP